MSKYEVIIKRILSNKIEVEANSKREAYQMVKETIDASNLLEANIMNISKPQITIRVKKSSKN